MYKGTLKRRGGSQGDSGDLLVFLFDHALLMVKQKRQGEQYKVYRRVRPLAFSPDWSLPRIVIAADPPRAPLPRHG